MWLIAIQSRLNITEQNLKINLASTKTQFLKAAKFNHKGLHQLHIYVHVLMRDEKEERKKEASKVKQHVHVHVDTNVEEDIRVLCLHDLISIIKPVQCAKLPLKSLLVCCLSRTGESGETLLALVLVSEEEGEAGPRQRVLQTQVLVERTHVQVDHLGEGQCVQQRKPLVRLGAGGGGRKGGGGAGITYNCANIHVQ